MRMYRERRCQGFFLSQLAAGCADAAAVLPTAQGQKAEAWISALG